MTPDDEENDPRYEWDDDDFDDPLDWGLEDEDDDIEYRDYTWPYDNGDDD